MAIDKRGNFLSCYIEDFKFDIRRIYQRIIDFRLGIERIRIILL